MHEITELILKYSQGRLSVIEEERLRRWRGESPTNETLFRELTDPQRVKEDANLQEESKFRVWDRLSALDEVTNTRLFRIRPRHARLGVAVAVVLFSIGIILLARNRNSSSPRPTLVVHELGTDFKAPTGANAILTLSNGDKIDLDRANTGNLSQQGNAQITKISNHELAYRNVAPNSNPASAGLRYNLLTTLVGGQTLVRLSDGSRVYLNAGSSIRYPTTFGNKVRQVEITGEAYFEIANMTEPFFVAANNLHIKVLGTRFNVMAYDDETTLETTVLSGAILVAEKGRTEILKPGEQFRVNSKNSSVDLARDVDTSGVLAWRNGQFEFSVSDIGEVMRQLQRWYPIQVSYENLEIPKLRLSGAISRAVKLSDVLKLLENNGAHFRVSGNRITVLN
jgi:transmembrane sensor